MIAIVTIEGVLCQPGTGSFVSAQVIPEGVALAKSLAHTFAVVLVTASQDQEDVKNYLSSRKPCEYAALVGPWHDPYATDEMSRVKRVEEIRAGGSLVALAVDANPDVCAGILRLGVPAMFTTWPATSTRAWGSVIAPEEEELREWDTLRAEVTAQHKLAGDQDWNDDWRASRYSD